MTERVPADRAVRVRGYEVPRDPARAGIVGKRRMVVGGLPIADGNRAERRAFKKFKKAGGKSKGGK